MKAITFLLLWIFCNAVIAAELTVQDKKVIADSVRKDLIDPESARFKWLPLIGDKTGPGNIRFATYCGLINSKNRLGGYTGDAPFNVLLLWDSSGVVSVTVSLIGSADWSSAKSRAILENCKQEGYANLHLAE